MDQSLAAGFIPVNTLQQRASLPFKPVVLKTNVSQSLATGFIPMNTRQQRASLPFNPGGDMLERKVTSPSVIMCISINRVAVLAVTHYHTWAWHIYTRKRMFYSLNVPATYTTVFPGLK